MTKIDEIDARIANEALAEYEASGKKSRPIEELWKEVGLGAKKRGRPRNNHKVHSIRCSDEEFEQIKVYLKQLRKGQTQVAAIAELEAKGQQKLKF